IVRAMRASLSLLVVIAACETAQPPPPAAPKAASEPAPQAQAAGASAPAPKVERLAADTPRTTVSGNRFVAPGGWGISVRGPATILEPPEPDAHIALVDVQGKDADAAVKAAWAAYKPDAKWPVKVVQTAPDREGWSDVHIYAYQTSPNERRDV